MDWQFLPLYGEEGGNQLVVHQSLLAIYIL